MSSLEDLVASEEGLAALTGAVGGLTSMLESLEGTLTGLTGSVDAMRGGLSGMGSASENAGKQTVTATGAIKNGFSKAAEGVRAFGGALESIASGPLPSASSAMSAVGSAMGGALTSGAHTAATALSELGPEGAAAGAALEGLAAVAAATVGVLTTLMGTAIEVSERIALVRESLAGLAGGAAEGAAAGRMISSLADKLPFARSQTQAWAASLLGVGEAGETLAAHVRAIAAAQALTAVTGGQGGAAAQKMFTMLAMGGKATETFMKSVHEGGKSASKILAQMGLNIKDLGGEAAVAKMNASQFGDAVTKALERRGAGALEEMSNSWPDIMSKARTGFLSLFDGLGPAVKPFMGAVKSLFGEFNKGGVAINILKPIVTTVLSTLFSWGTKALNAIHKGFLYVVIGALMAYIAMRPAIDAVKRFATSATMLQGLRVILVGVAIVAGLMALPFILAGVAALLFVAAVAAVGAAVTYIAGFASQAISALGAWVSGAASAAADFVSGLVQGIAAGAGAVADAVSNLASGALGAFRSVFSMHSPSRVLMEHGEDDMAGAVATGVDKGAPKVDAAMEGLGGGRPSAKGRGKGGGGGDRVFAPQFTNCQFGSLSKADLYDWLEEWWEMQGAAGPEPEPT